jgi:hypothetical protein
MLKINLASQPCPNDKWGKQKNENLQKINSYPSLTVLGLAGPNSLQDVGTTKELNCRKLVFRRSASPWLLFGGLLTKMIEERKCWGIGTPT